MILISFILVILASISNAIMDTLIHHHDTSIFNKYKTGFWADALDVSWRNKYINSDPIQGRIKLFWIINVPSTFTDGWHFFKSIMIFFLVAAIVLYTPVFSVLIDFAVLGLIWNLTFNLFYNVFLIKK